MEGSYITRDFERHVKKKKKRLWKLNVSFYRSSAMGTWREGPFIWDSEDSVHKRRLWKWSITLYMEAL
jgi:hypothetical protein